MDWIVEIDSGGLPLSSMAIGLGMWVFFGWCWVTTRERSLRTEVLAMLGLAAAAAFAGGYGGARIVGEVGLSSLGAIVAATALILFLPLERGVDRWRLLDHLVPGGVAALSVARLGCLFQGCDFGVPTNGAWGVVYDSGTRAWATHVDYLRLSPHSELSLAVHPFALYLGGWGLIAAGLGEWKRRRGGRPGQAMFLSAGVFLAGGGVIEWLREPITVPQIAGGMSVYPFLYIFGALAALAGWVVMRSSKD